MSTQALLAYALEEKTPYFEPDTDVQVYYEDEDGWFTLQSTTYTHASLVKALQHGSRDGSTVRFTHANAKQYLHHLKNTGIDDDVHEHTHITRERLVKLADNGYTRKEDFLEAASPYDIAKEAKLDDSIVRKISASYTDPFESATTFQTNSQTSNGPLETLRPENNFQGWTLRKHTPNTITWVSNGRLNLTVKSTPSDKLIVTSSVPEKDRHISYRKGWGIEIEPTHRPAEDVLEETHEWLTENEFQFTDDLTVHKHIGPSTQDYLHIEFGITSTNDLKDFIKSQPESFTSIFGEKHATDLEKDVFNADTRTEK